MAMTGGRAEKFRKGWALVVMSFGVAHHYSREAAGLAASACGRSKVPAGALHHAGSWRRCKTCEKRITKAEER